MSRQRKMYVSLLGVAVVALVVDWALLDGGSAPASAEGAAAVAAAQAELAAAGDGTAARVERTLAGLDASLATLREGSDLAERLERLALDESAVHGEDVANPFDLPATWRQPVEAAQAETSVAREEPDAAARFRREHRLQAILQLSDGAGLAIVNDRPVRVGERIGGFTLRGVGGDAATFEREGRRATLELERSGLLQASPGQAAEPAEPGQAEQRE